MGFADKLWDDTLGGPQPEGALSSALKINALRSPSLPGPSPEQSPMDFADRAIDRRKSEDFLRHQQEVQKAVEGISIAKSTRPTTLDVSRSLPAGFAAGPFSPGAPSPSSRENVWRSVFHPGSNKVGMDRLGSGKFDKATPGGPSVYDWWQGDA